MATPEQLRGRQTFVKICQVDSCTIASRQRLTASINNEQRSMTAQCGSPLTSCLNGGQTRRSSTENRRNKQQRLPCSRRSSTTCGDVHVLIMGRYDGRPSSACCRPQRNRIGPLSLLGLFVVFDAATVTGRASALTHTPCPIQLSLGHRE